MHSQKHTHSLFVVHSLADVIAGEAKCEHTQYMPIHTSTHTDNSGLPHVALPWSPQKTGPDSERNVLLGNTQVVQAKFSLG